MISTWRARPFSFGLSDLLTSSLFFSFVFFCFSFFVFSPFSFLPRPTLLLPFRPLFFTSSLLSLLPHPLPPIRLLLLIRLLFPTFFPVFHRAHNTYTHTHTHKRSRAVYCYHLFSIISLLEDCFLTSLDEYTWSQVKAMTQVGQIRAGCRHWEEEGRGKWILWT